MRLWAGETHKRRVAALAMAAAVGVAGCGGATHAAASGSGDAKVIKLAYGSTYVFDSDQLTNQFYNQVKQQFEAQNPGIKVQLVPIPGSYTDIVTKLSLLYRSSSTAPDVAELPTAQIGEWASSGFLAPLNTYLKSASWWAGFPGVVQSEGTIGGRVYAVNQGENDFALYYNKTMFQKAGLPVPWTPHTWNDILAAATKIKQTLPGVIPLWMMAGSASGAIGVMQGITNLLVGSSTPTIQSGSKFVVDSPGIRASLTFLKEAATEDLTAPVSRLFSPNADVAPQYLFPQGKLAISFGGNFLAPNWKKSISAPYWQDGPQTIGITPLPNEAGTGYASTLGGWDYAMSADSGNPSAAFKLISLMENDQNSIDAANWAGFVPPNESTWTLPAFADFWPGITQFGTILRHSTLLPSSSNYPIWAQGMGNATGEIVQNPTTSVNAAVNTLSSYVSNQLGTSSTEKLP